MPRPAEIPRFKTAGALILLIGFLVSFVIKPSPRFGHFVRPVRNDGEHSEQQADDDLILRRRRSGMSRQITENYQPGRNR